MSLEHCTIPREKERESPVNKMTEKVIRYQVRVRKLRGVDKTSTIAEMQEAYGFTTSVWGVVVDEWNTSGTEVASSGSEWQGVGEGGTK